MGRFCFSLQNILNMKEKLETQAKNEYAQANAHLLMEQEKLWQLENRLQRNQELLKKELETSLTLKKKSKARQEGEEIEK